MEYVPFGKTPIRISALSFGAGPISTLMVGNQTDAQIRVVEHAIRRGINWFDTAATYGGGQSEESLGQALSALGGHAKVHIATKVRLFADDFKNLRDAIRRSFDDSLKRLRCTSVTLLQLHNAITVSRDDQPTSLSPRDVLQRGGIADIFSSIREEGLAAHIGLTGIGESRSLREVVDSGRFESVQVPYHLLNPSAGWDVGEDFPEVNYGNVISHCARRGMGVLAIRVLAGGALAGNPPSPHTLKTPYFPLELFDRDRDRARRIAEMLGLKRNLPAEAIRFALAHPHVQSALIGFASTEQIDHAIAAIESSVPHPDWAAILPPELLFDAIRVEKCVP
ncbi:aldo/keto reductase [Planctomicrobium sp. SH661]|uniref:aldo/keto reductase n=1 Tax=Planctomicrobium sp. SH661 TaxID=3448124 RepID=UPI003F5BEDAA